MRLTRLFAAVLAAASLLCAVPALAGARYLAPAQQSASANIAADANGGLHAAFTGYDRPTGDLVYYRYCAASCEAEGNWRQVSLDVGRPINVQLGVTPDGRPRLLITGFGSGTAGAGRMYYYGECNEDCTDRTHWSLVPVANSAERTLSGLFEYRIPEHSFVVDSEGRPHFIYVDANYIAEPDHYGTFHLTCSTACTDPENWTETNLAVKPNQYSTELWDQVALAVAPGGRLRLLAKVYALDNDGTQLEEGLYFYQCEAGCDSLEHWRRTRVIDTGYGSYPNPTWDLEVLPDGRPRAVLFAGSDMSQPSLAHQLIYFWCDTDCDNDKNWNGHAVTATGDGESPDLALTSDGQPRIAFLGEYGDLGTLACDVDCESDHGQWSLKLQDASADAARDRPVALPFTCDGEVWNGMLPRIAIAAGRSWFAYDLVDSGRCLYKQYGDPVTYAEFHELWRGARMSWSE